MSKKKLLFLSILSFAVLCLGACGAISNKNISLPIQEILSPNDLPAGLADVKIFWIIPEKEAVYITSLDQSYLDIVNVIGNSITLSEDYKYLAYVASETTSLSSIRLVDAQTKEERTLVSIDKDISHALRVRTPAFSPDGKNIIFRVDITETEFDIASVDFNGENLHFFNTAGFNLRLDKIGQSPCGKLPKGRHFMCEQKRNYPRAH